MQRRSLRRICRGWVKNTRERPWSPWWTGWKKRSCHSSCTIRTSTRKNSISWTESNTKEWGEMRNRSRTETLVGHLHHHLLMQVWRQHPAVQPLVGLPHHHLLMQVWRQHPAVQPLVGQPHHRLLLSRTGICKQLKWSPRKRGDSWKEEDTEGFKERKQGEK